MIKINDALIFLKIIKFFDFIIKPLLTFCFKIYYRQEDKRFPLSKCKNDLLLTPAHVLAKKIRNKEISSEQLVRLFIDRIKEVQPIVNCVVQDRFIEAIEEAKQVDKILSESDIPEKYSESKTPFLGVPFSCKESIWVKGMSNTSGLVSRNEFRAPQDAVVVKLMKESGAILTCTTNTSEVCMWLESTNFVTGTTKNPYNLSRIAGGSSGGEGSIISSCGSVWGLGSDIGGSIRIPSTFNGIYGHKPTSHLVSHDYEYPSFKGISSDMGSIGPMCRYASDLKHMLKIISGERYEDLRPNFEGGLDLKKVKFYFIRDFQGAELISEPSKDAKNALEKSIKFIEQSLETRVTEIKLDKFRYSLEMWSSKMNNGENGKEWYRHFLKGHKDQLNPTKELVRTLTCVQDTYTLPTVWLAVSGLTRTNNCDFFLKLAEELKEQIQGLIKDDGVILFPSFPIVAPYHNQSLFTNSLDFIYYGIFNVFGFPVTQVPMGLNDDGLPTGVQIVANDNMDHLTIKLAEYFESNLVGWIPPF